MDALLALQSSLHCLAVFCSAIADCDNASSPTNTAHTAKVGFITHVSGKTPPTPTASGHSVGEKETAALAAAMWSAAPDRQRAIVRSLFLRCQEQKANNVGQEKTAAPQGAAVDCRPVAPAVNAR